MWDNLVVKKIFDYCELIRLNKPIGFLLLMWPCWFGLALLKTETSIEQLFSLFEQEYKRIST